MYEYTMYIERNLTLFFVLSYYINKHTFQNSIRKRVQITKNNNTEWFHLSLMDYKRFPLSQFYKKKAKLLALQ